MKLLIHDLTPSSSAYEWSKMIDELAESHTVYALDLLGCGRSDKPSITYANYLYVQLITDFAKQVIKETQQTPERTSGITFDWYSLISHYSG